MLRGRPIELGGPIFQERVVNTTRAMHLRETVYLAIESLGGTSGKRVKANPERPVAMRPVKFTFGRFAVEARATT